MNQDEKILDQIDQWLNYSEEIAETVIKTPKLLNTVIDGVNSSTSR
jgi:hypothetical protein